MQGDDGGGNDDDDALCTPFAGGATAAWVATADLFPQPAGPGDACDAPLLLFPSAADLDPAAATPTPPKSSASLKARAGLVLGLLVLVNAACLGALALVATSYPKFTSPGVLAFTFGLRHAVDAVLLGRPLLRVRQRSDRRELAEHALVLRLGEGRDVFRVRDRRRVALRVGRGVCAAG